MGKYSIALSKRAEKDLSAIKRSGRKADMEKIGKLFRELTDTPRDGSGKPEQLKHYVGEIWSRRINKKDRLVYEIFENEVLIIVIQALGHYEDR